MLAAGWHADPDPLPLDEPDGCAPHGTARETAQVRRQAVVGPEAGEEARPEALMRGVGAKPADMLEAPFAPCSTRGVDRPLGCKVGGKH